MFSQSTGPFSVAGWLACLGGCEGVGVKLYHNCMKAEGKDPSKSRRATSSTTVNPCLSIADNFQYSCPAQQKGLLSAVDCPQTLATGGSGGVIHAGR